MGCDVGVVVGEFSDPQPAYEFELNFRWGEVATAMHGPEWETYVREVHEVRNFNTATLRNLLARNRGC